MAETITLEYEAEEKQRLDHFLTENRVPERAPGKVHAFFGYHARRLFEAPRIFFAVCFKRVVYYPPVLKGEGVFAGRQGGPERCQRDSSRLAAFLHDVNTRSW